MFYGFYLGHSVNRTDVDLSGRSLLQHYYKIFQNFYRKGIIQNISRIFPYVTRIQRFIFPRDEGECVERD